MNYILLISEDKLSAASLKAVMAEDCLVEETSPLESLNIVSSRRPNLVLLDSMLSEIDSFELLGKLLRIIPGLTVIKLVDSFGRKGVEAIDSGAFDVIEKPLDPDRVRHAVNRAIEREKLMLNINAKPSLSAFQENDGSSGPNGGRDDFFHDLFQTVAENFPDTGKMGMDIIKVLRKNFYFNNIVLFLKSGTVFIPSATMGVEESIRSKLTLSSAHPIIQRFSGGASIINLDYETGIPFECMNFMSVLNCRIALPLKTVNGKLTGFLAIGGKLTGQSACMSEISFLCIVADYIATVLDNAFLHREITFQKDYQEAIFQNIPTGVIGVDREGRIIIFNAYAEEIFGLRAEDVKMSEIEKAGSQVASLVRKTLDSGELFIREEIKYVPKNIILGISTNIIKNMNGENEGAVAIFQNLTRIKEMEEREKSVEKNKYWAALASRLSHELKNPLVAIKTFSQMLPTHYEDKEFRTDFSSVVQSEIFKIDGIIEKINRLADSMELKKERFDIVRFLSGTMNKIRDSKGINMEVFDNEPCYVWGDISKLSEAVEYVFDFIEEDGGDSVRVSVACAGENVLVNIEENGTKITYPSPEDFFMPFNPEIKSPVSIGVMLTKKILETHGGDFLFAPLQKGKRLTFILPCAGKDKDA